MKFSIDQISGLSHDHDYNYMENEIILHKSVFKNIELKFANEFDSDRSGSLFKNKCA